MLIHRSIFRELFYNFIVIILSLSVLLFMEKFVRLTRVLMGKGADLMDIMKVFLYLQPSILMLSVPMAILISIFLTYGRMAADSELVVLKSSGMSFPGISRSALLLSFSGFLILLYVSLYLTPFSMHHFKRLLHETVTKKASLILEEETFSEVFKDTVIYVREIPSKNRFRGIFVYRERGPYAKTPLVIVAEKGEIVSDYEEGIIKLLLSNGQIHATDKKDSSEVSFAEYDFTLTTGVEVSWRTQSHEIALSDLWKDRKKKLLWDIELNRRFAIPFACLIFGFLGPSISGKMGKIGRLGGFSFSLSLLVLYYGMLIMGEGLAKAEKVSPVNGVWLPNVFFGILAIIFFYRACKDSPSRKL
jgi:lipopolysaccharide export system permease protein